MSSSLAVIELKRPFSWLAACFKVPVLSLAITMVPLACLTKEPSGNEIGAPWVVPIPKMESWVWLLKRGSSSSTKLAGRLSVISRIRPPSTPPSLNTFKACFTASMGSLPLMGIMSGLRLFTILRMVLVSSVRGVTTCGVPAYTTSAVRPSSARFRMSVSFILARTNRDGAMSLAYMESDRSSTITWASIFFCTA